VVRSSLVKKPTVSQYVLLRRMLGADRRAFRLPGGFWTVEGVAVSQKSGVGQVPDWSASTSTVMSAERAGFIARAMKWPEAWRDERVLTPAGEAAAEAPWTGKVTDAMRQGLLSNAQGFGGNYYAEDLATLGYIERRDGAWAMTPAGVAAMARL
jgi:hypothetical protein